MSVTKIAYEKEDPTKTFFLVQLSAESKTVALTRLKYLLSQPIKWERLERKEVFQCRRCQKIGHASKNCTLGFRCVKYSGNHGPIKEGVVCPATTDKKLLKCANCGSNEHPASYAKCPYLTLAYKVKDDAKTINIAIKKAKINKINRSINPNLSFANAANSNIENFPPLPSQTPRQSRIAGFSAPKLNTASISNDTHFNNAQNFSHIEEILTNFQNSMIAVLKTHLDKINNQVQENSRKIEVLYSQFDE